jgi:hypothetical protein
LDTPKDEVNGDDIDNLSVSFLSMEVWLMIHKSGDLIGPVTLSWICLVPAAGKGLLAARAHLHRYRLIIRIKSHLGRVVRLALVCMTEGAREEFVIFVDEIDCCFSQFRSTGFFDMFCLSTTTASLIAVWGSRTSSAVVSKAPNTTLFPCSHVLSHMPSFQKALELAESGTKHAEKLGPSLWQLKKQLKTPKDL